MALATRPKKVHFTCCIIIGYCMSDECTSLKFAMAVAHARSKVTKYRTEERRKVIIVVAMHIVLT